LNISSVVTGIEAITLVANPSGGAFSGPGVTGNVFSITDAGIGDHTISYLYLDENNCLSYGYQNIAVLSFTTIFNYSNQEINASNFEEFVKVYPNPVVERLSLEIPFIENVHDFQVELFDMQGRLLFVEKNLSQTNQVFNLSLQNFESGMYVVQVASKSSELLAVKRIVKK